MILQQQESSGKNAENKTEVNSDSDRAGI
jgi:hypothetical protein